MRVNDSINIFRLCDASRRVILLKSQNRNGNDFTPYSLGGYSALVMLGILEEDRDTSDCDITGYGKGLFTPRVVIPRMMNISMIDLPFECNVDGDSRKKMDLKEALSYLDSDTQIAELTEMGMNCKDRIDVRITRKNMLTAYRSSISDLIVQSKTSVPVEIPTETIVAINNFPVCSDLEFSEAVKNLVEIGKTPGKSEFMNVLARILKITDEFDKYDLRVRKLFGVSVKEVIRLRNFNIDFFTLDAEFAKTAIKKDGILITNPYHILRAKQIYCNNPKTNDKTFDKHLQDLIKSRSKIRIDSVNSPKEIDKLIKSREISKENDSKEEPNIDVSISADFTPSEDGKWIAYDSSKMREWIDSGAWVSGTSRYTIGVDPGVQVQSGRGLFDAITRAYTPGI